MVAGPARQLEAAQRGALAAGRESTAGKILSQNTRHHPLLKQRVIEVAAQHLCNNMLHSCAVHAMHLMPLDSTSHARTTAADMHSLPAVLAAQHAAAPHSIAYTLQVPSTPAATINAGGEVRTMQMGAGECPPANAIAVQIKQCWHKMQLLQ